MSGQDSRLVEHGARLVVNNGMEKGRQDRQIDDALKPAIAGRHMPLAENLDGVASLLHDADRACCNVMKACGCRADATDGLSTSPRGDKLLEVLAEPLEAI